MKSILFSLVACAAVLTVRAEWLSWCVSNGDFDTEAISGVAYMRVGYVNPNDGSQDPAASGTAMVSYSDSGSDTTASDGMVSYTGGDDEYKVNVTGLSAANYGFYIELLNSSGEVIGRSGDTQSNTYATYASLSKYVSTGSISDVPAVEVWHGGGFSAVPEPSSLMLLALGAGLAGLRRKLRGSRKAKKGSRR